MQQHLSHRHRGQVGRVGIPSLGSERGRPIVNLALRGLGAGGIGTQHLLEVRPHKLGILGKIGVLASRCAVHRLPKQGGIIREGLKDFELMIDRHDRHVNILWKLALQEVQRRVMGEAPRVIVVTMKDHGHQANLSQGIELGPRTACTDRFSALDESKRSDFLRFAVVQDMEIFSLQIVHGTAFFVANHDVEQDFVGPRLNGVLGWRGSLGLLRKDGRSRRDRHCRRPKAYRGGKLYHGSIPSLLRMSAAC